MNSYYPTWRFILDDGQVLSSLKALVLVDSVVYSKRRVRLFNSKHGEDYGSNYDITFQKRFLWNSDILIIGLKNLTTEYTSVLTEFDIKLQQAKCQTIFLIHLLLGSKFFIFTLLITHFSSRFGIFYITNYTKLLHIYFNFIGFPRFACIWYIADACILFSLRTCLVFVWVMSNVTLFYDFSLVLLFVTPFFLSNDKKRKGNVCNISFSPTLP